MSGKEVDVGRGGSQYLNMYALNLKASFLPVKLTSGVPNCGRAFKQMISMQCVVLAVGPLSLYVHLTSFT